MNYVLVWVIINIVNPQTDPSRLIHKTYPSYEECADVAAKLKDNTPPAHIKHAVFCIPEDDLVGAVRA